jgi:hypothetical protein
MERARARLSQDRGSRLHHYRWAVERVCLEWTYPHIAQSHGDAHEKYPWPQTIRQQVGKVLKAIQIPLKPIAAVQDSGRFQ